MNARIAISGILGILLVGLMVGFAGRLRARAALARPMAIARALAMRRAFLSALVRRAFARAVREFLQQEQQDKGEKTS